MFLSFVEHFPVLIVDNFGILALLQLLIPDSFGILAFLQVLIAENVGILALFLAFIADNFGIFNTLGKINTIQDLNLLLPASPFDTLQAAPPIH